MTIYYFFPALSPDKTFKENLSRSLGFKPSYVSPIVPIPVLMVYPAENAVFQQGVVALAEFLQWHGGCNVAVDMWQQGKIAKLGPMRWLAEQVKASDVVLIVRPETKNVRSLAKSVLLDCFHPVFAFTMSTRLHQDRYCHNQDILTLHYAV